MIERKIPYSGASIYPCHTASVSKEVIYVLHPEDELFLSLAFVSLDDPHHGGGWPLLE